MTRYFLTDTNIVYRADGTEVPEFLFTMTDDWAKAPAGVFAEALEKHTAEIGGDYLQAVRMIVADYQAEDPEASFRDALDITTAEMDFADLDVIEDPDARAAYAAVLIAHHEHAGPRPGGGF